LNEPNTPQMLEWFNLPVEGLPPGLTVPQALRLARLRIRWQIARAAIQQLPAGRCAADAGRIAGRARARSRGHQICAPFATRGGLAHDDGRSAGGGREPHRTEAHRGLRPWFEAARADEFLGTQTYTRTMVGKKDERPQWTPS